MNYGKPEDCEGCSFVHCAVCQVPPKHRVLTRNANKILIKTTTDNRQVRCRSLVGVHSDDKRPFFRVRDAAASDEDQASCCFYSLLDYLEEQWKRSVQENNMLQGPDFAGMKDYLLVRCIILSVVMWPWCKSIFFFSFSFVQKNFQNRPKYLAEILFECLTAEKKILDAASEEQVR